MKSAEHHYAAFNIADQKTPRMICACGHAEPFDGDVNDVLLRMNAHIRNFYTDEEWETQMQRTKVATLDTSTSKLTMSPEGSKS